MSLQRRVLFYLLVCAPLVWAVALWFSVAGAREEVTELFDAELIHLARQVQATLGQGGPLGLREPVQVGRVDDTELEAEDLATVVWDRHGRLMLVDRGGTGFPYRSDASGFHNVVVGEDEWRVYYLQSLDGAWLVAAGQKIYERDEVVFDLTVSQLTPWLAMLPVLLVVMALAVGKALAPLRQVSRELAVRNPDDLQTLSESGRSTELVPLVAAMNALFVRIREAMARERRFTADAAHELRTPLAALRAQWDVVRRETDPVLRAHAEARMSAGFERLERLVSQMLAMSRVEGANETTIVREAIAWPAIVENAFSDCLPLAERRHIELECDWPAAGAQAMPLYGDPNLLTVLLRNLLDNAVRYAPVGSAVRLVFDEDGFAVENDGPALDASVRARLGERYFRPEGQAEVGSGLGISIVQRIAALHALEVVFVNHDDNGGAPAGGVRVRVGRARNARPAR